jgi:hypothetical protein
VRRRDVKAVLALADPSIRVRLEDRLAGGQPAEVYWPELETILGLGGSFTLERGLKPGRLEFCAPYTYSRYPVPPLEGLVGEVDPWVLTDDAVVVRARADNDAAVVDILSYALVSFRVGPVGEPPRWIGVKLLDDRDGFVSTRDIRDPTDYHACFAKSEFEWRMVVFDRTLVPWRR